MNTLPPKRSGESTRAYYRRLNTLRASLRAYLPGLVSSAVQAGKNHTPAMKMSQIAAEMGVTVPWLYTVRTVDGEYNPRLLPKQRQDEDALAYYVRLRELRDAIRDELPALLAKAVEEAEQDFPKPTMTQVAADLGVTESYLYKQLRKSN